MRENLHRFFRAARGAGVKLSPAESIDAMRAVAKVGIADRAILRDTFLLTLAKSQDEKKALGDCFDLFFDQPEPQSSPEDGKSEEQDSAESNSATGSPGEATGGDHTGVVHGPAAREVAETATRTRRRCRRERPLARSDRSSGPPCPAASA